MIIKIFKLKNNFLNLVSLSANIIFQSYFTVKDCMLFSKVQEQGRHT